MKTFSQNAKTQKMGSRKLDKDTQMPMKQAVSRDDRRQPAAEQESERLVSSRVQMIYERGDVETVLVLDNNSSLHTSPPQLVETKSLLSPTYAGRKVYSKRDGEWQSPALENNESDDLMSSRVGDESLRGGCGVRQVNSTPRQAKRAKTSGFEHQSSLLVYEEEKIINPISFVLSWLSLSSVGQKLIGVKELGKIQDDTVDDDLITIAESIVSYYYCFFCCNDNGLAVLQ
jgi:hypothetical protein